MVKQIRSLVHHLVPKAFIRRRKSWYSPVYRPDPVFDVRGDLIQFTSLPPSIIDILLERREGLAFTQ